MEQRKRIFVKRVEDIFRGTDRSYFALLVEPGKGLESEFFLQNSVSSAALCGSLFIISRMESQKSEIQNWDKHEFENHYAATHRSRTTRNHPLP